MLITNAGDILVAAKTQLNDAWVHYCSVSCLTLRRSWKACVWMTWGRRWTMTRRLSSCSSVERLLTCWAHLTSGRLPINCSVPHSVVTALCTVWMDNNYQLKGLSLRWEHENQSQASQKKPSWLLRSFWSMKDSQHCELFLSLSQQW